MTTVKVGAARRPTLSLNYDAKAKPSTPKFKRRFPTLSTQELRRLVAEMVD